MGDGEIMHVRNISESHYLFTPLLVSGCYNDYSSLTKEHNEKPKYRIGKNIELGKLNEHDRQGLHHARLAACTGTTTNRRIPD